MDNERNFKPDRTQVEQMLSTLIRNRSIWLFAIKTNQGGVISAKFHANSLKQMLDWVEEQNLKGGNIYFSVNSLKPQFKGRKAKKIDVEHVDMFHVDVDILDVYALTQLQQFHPKPSLIICSGGGYQAFWLLDEPTTNFDDVEAINMGLAQKLGGDNCHNIDRIMRVAGTINWPNRKKAKAGRKPVLSYIVEDTSDAK